jgi:hypothetical protein
MFNEPGYEEMRGKPETEARSQQMKAEIQLWTIRQCNTAMLASVTRVAAWQHAPRN